MDYSETYKKHASVYELAQVYRLTLNEISVHMQQYHTKKAHKEGSQSLRGKDAERVVNSFETDS